MKKRRIFILGILSMVLVSMASCSKDDVENKQNKLKPAIITSNSFVPSDMTEEEMIKAGWTLVATHSSTIREKRDLLKEETGVPFTKLHAKYLGFDLDTDEGKSKLKSFFSYATLPATGIWFTKDFKVDAKSRTPEQIGWWATTSVIMGMPKITIDTNGADLPDETNETYIANDLDTAITQKKTYSCKKGTKSSWQVKESASIKIGAKTKINVPVAGAEVSMEVQVGVESTQSGENSTETTVTDETTVPVPAHSKVKIAIVTKYKKSKIDYLIPIQITGNIMIDVDDKYHVPETATSFNISDFKDFISKSKDERGSAEAINIESRVYLSPAISL